MQKKEELEKVVKEAPNNKATGPQGIANEMLKKLGSKAKNRFLRILNACLKLKTIPNGWKKSRIYPIAKKETFSGSLEETRPITLTVHSRKILTKIVTKRLSKRLERYPILNENNHVALPNTSTEIPIVTTMHMMENAYTNDKEMWILCQDISKAYDSIHIPMLKKALRRIKINEDIVELIGNIFQGRENTVITSLGITNTYEVQDGVDQGEPIAPLLWRIYYDPLLCEVYKKVQGYSMEVEYVEGKLKKKLICSKPALAYMDDTIWLARSKNEWKG